ncbi:bifunctional [glutamine synthetase] adenylyltransferase/[glutamine synthetase]-adenylyl-L-tyrosine phosphorylase [Pseudaquidulcibacter saccharophilus]|uniref:bifunctional [glutamine synthetase] adenylyltransferase/[glutamine synthetase]-adenylyl-L-tyrosine phosphorylase n=1 Tax=Pseudaquidulcibacter saccharophilus TaxID=2831900 RepID=UPI001EFF2148|nr:bifunctional [glutamine synthetase] adenylyltransferase/[glutamine synthetase]-adenylyl-L-tyrosine phosphorylase [Pseudaquidulcibacter saccharophilus]
MYKINSLGGIKDAFALAIANAPYLDRINRKYPELFDELTSTPPNEYIAKLCDMAQSARGLPLYEATKQLRIGKAKMHFALAVYDLSKTLETLEVTNYLSNYADIAMQSAVKLACDDAPDRDKRAFVDGAVPGLFIVAMGKHGANELNYSSDIDLAAFYDRDFFHEDYAYQASPICVRILGAVSKIMEDVTPENYVFRVDWRLRPDPLSTPLAVSTQMAETYYEAVGQNWERAAMIKARPIAGDFARATEFIEFLQPFIWRKYLDHAAVLDVGSILKQIHKHNRSVDYDNPAFNLKLGRGGIREIEFFTQTQQLILGGRDVSLRKSRTVDGLKALSHAGRIGKNIAEELTYAYSFLRDVEHRVQMLEDEQTHSLPENEEKRARIAALSGYSSLDDFDRAIRECREMVRDHITGLFPESDSLSVDGGSLIFTGVDDDPETLETLYGLGFKKPALVSQTIRSWHHGRIRATRTPRAREILTNITPQLLKTIADTQEPDLVFSRFSDFMTGISAGVQTLALFQTEPEVLAEFCMTLAISSSLANDLAKRPAILDAMLSPRFLEPLVQDVDGERLRLLQSQLEVCDDFELALDIVRRFKREEAFRIGYHLLHNRTDGISAGKNYSDLAICCIKCLLPYAIKEVERQFGEFDGQIAVCGWGKLGGGELSANSDLDLMVIYDPKEGVECSSGERALSAESYFAKVTQRLVAALSVLTAEGPLYEVDMQLRPSGKKGPVAVRYSSFKSYYEAEAWTWEFQALTRLTPIAGDSELMDKIRGTTHKLLTRERDIAKTIADIVEMRGKIAEHLKPRGEFDFKRLDGGIITLEFLTQAYELIYANKFDFVLSANTAEALANLGEFGLLDKEKVGRLLKACEDLNNARQILDIISGSGYQLDSETNASKQAIANILNSPDFNVALAGLNDARNVVKEAWEALSNSITSL